MIDIVLTTWRREYITSKMLEALERNTKTPYRLIIIDNGSERWYQRDYLRDGDIYIKLDQNYGLEYAKNLGMQFIKSDLFISTDNDILPYHYDPDWLSQLIGLMDRYPEYAAISLRPQILVGTGNIFHENVNEVVEFSHVPGYLRIMRTDLTKEAGAWNERRPLRGHEELWISGKFREMGYKVGWANNIKCWHLFGEDNWGYGTMPPEDHGHNPVSGLPKDNKEEILKYTGVKI